MQGLFRAHGDKDEKNSKTKPKLTHKTDFQVRARISFLVPSYIYLEPKLTHKTDIKVRARISFLVPSYIYLVLP